MEWYVLQLTDSLISVKINQFRKRFKCVKDYKIDTSDGKFRITLTYNSYVKIYEYKNGKLVEV